jgi:hypothetical protein
VYQANTAVRREIKAGIVRAAVSNGSGEMVQVGKPERLRSEGNFAGYTAHMNKWSLRLEWELNKTENDRG